MNPVRGRSDFGPSARSSKIKIRTSSCNKAQLKLYIYIHYAYDEVQILIFDDPAEGQRSQRTKYSTFILSTCVSQLYSIA